MSLSLNLSFRHIPEKERTKHVHRLHPYKGKFIPQLAEHFLSRCFKLGDIVLDPFSGSGTTLVQANEMEIHVIGIDVSEFNAMIARVKLSDVDAERLKKAADEISSLKDERTATFEKELKEELRRYNEIAFPKDFAKRFRKGEVSGDYLRKKEEEFLKIYMHLVEKHRIRIYPEKEESFLDRWYLPGVKEEMRYIMAAIETIEDRALKEALMIVLSRSVRSARATAHMDLDRLKRPRYTPYYCYKHFKICKPVFSVVSIFKRYAKDTAERFAQYGKLKTNAYHVVLTGDSRVIDIFEGVRKEHAGFYELLRERKITGIFTSPPYVGQIDYHEQHAYAYELFGIRRRDELEIGPLCKGKGREARTSYVEGISRVLRNCLRYMIDDPKIIVVANDEFNLYPEIARRSGLRIVREYRRPVLHRTSRDRTPYYESVFIMTR